MTESAIIPATGSSASAMKSCRTHAYRSTRRRRAECQLRARVHLWPRLADAPGVPVRVYVLKGVAAAAKVVLDHIFFNLIDALARRGDVVHHEASRTQRVAEQHRVPSPQMVIAVAALPFPPHLDALVLDSNNNTATWNQFAAQLAEFLDWALHMLNHARRVDEAHAPATTRCIRHTVRSVHERCKWQV